MMWKWLALLIIPGIISADDFCNGWDRGFEAGYCYGKYSCLAPIAPICPLPKLTESGFQGGYNRGFLAGQEKRAQKDAAGSYVSPPIYSSPAAGSTHQERFNQAMDDAGASALQIGATLGEARRQEEAAEISKARFRAEMSEKSLRFEKENPGEPNPYKAELDRLDEAEKAKVVEQEKTAKQWKMVGIILGGLLVVMLIAAGNE